MFLKYNIIIMQRIDSLKNELQDLDNTSLQPIGCSFVLVFAIIIWSFFDDSNIGIKGIVLIIVLIIYLYLSINYNIKKKSLQKQIDEETTKNWNTKNLIYRSSEKYLKIKDLNNSIKHYKINPTIEIKANATSKRQYDNFDYDYLLNDYINNNKQFFDNLVYEIDYNKNVKSMYNDNFKNIINAKSRIKNDEELIDRYYFLNLEAEIIKELYINIVDEISFIIIVEYISPQGMNRLKKSKSFSINEVKDREKRITNLTKEQKEYERLLLTDSLRYDVFKRDNFKCVICGASAKDDGVKLHCDHIIPISKGGKTVLSNLRTLCDRCNLGKRDKYDFDGLN